MKLPIFVAIMVSWMFTSSSLQADLAPIESQIEFVLTMDPLPPPVTIEVGLGVVIQTPAGPVIVYEVEITVRNPPPGVHVKVLIDGVSSGEMNVPIGGPYVIEVVTPDPGPGGPVPNIDVQIDEWQHLNIYDLPDVEDIEPHV